MNKIYGYARISRKEQSIDRQIRNIRAACPDVHVVQEAYTGRTMQRPEWDKLFSKVSNGDTIIFDSVSRMSRSADDGVQTYFQLMDRGVSLVFLKEPYINTATYMEASQQSIQSTGNEIADIYVEATNKVIKLLAEKQIVKAFEQAEKEVSDLRQRTMEGIEIARLNGKQIGQKIGNKLHIKKKGPAMELIRRYSRDFEGNLNDIETMKLVELSRNTYYKYKKELLADYVQVSS
ncbi:recombinase family protein [Anaerovibrio sp.]|uniref:recombinase family protein n=1 Tax=Anaerovibrio sp. TaxID=1872532 RepID=UPI0025C11D8D|nr:recombinase family protein [Anaerovibrio sp.]MBR2143259.1 recombinase family protein [Anaerovibrio sp.]